MNPVARYTSWLHTQWPAGGVEKLPLVNEDGTTNIPGVYVVGDLRGIPLLKFAADSGARAVQHILADKSFPRTDSTPERDQEILDVVIIGAGVSGMSAALEAKYAGLSLVVVESSEPFSTIINFPKGKPIYTYPNSMVPEGDLQMTANIKESLLDELRDQTLGKGIRPWDARAQRVVSNDGVLEVVLGDDTSLRAHRVIVALGRSGDFRTLDVPGEDLEKVYNRLHDPNDFCNQNTLVVGGGDSALETAIALARCGSEVTLSYRKKEFARPKSENVDAIDKLAVPAGDDNRAGEPSEPSEPGKPAAPASPGRITLKLNTHVSAIKPAEVTLEHKDGKKETIPNDVVFTMIGREAPLDFFRRSRIRIAGDWSVGKVIGLLAFFVFCVALYNWKSGGALGELFYTKGWFPTTLTTTFAAAVANPASLLGTLAISASGPAFWYTLAYCIVVVLFGVKRIRRRKTPYIKAQTTTLIAIQVLPLFLLPEIILPLLGHNGLLWRPFAEALFPVVDYGHGREYWRAYGLILAWPLNVYNVFTQTPLGWWLAISFVQTGLLIPLGIYFWGKGAYCGWICSCGALAETLGDTHRHKMPHGPRWNRLNMMGQLVLLIAIAILGLRIYGWAGGGEAIERIFLFSKEQYKSVVDVFLAGAVGYGVYFWFSGRVWCRFMCPLAALMHIYARFSRFRILADKKKCISCNVCTSVCHQGIDIMNFANKGMPMEDPECVRCSACVYSCPTGVLTFGRVDREGHESSRDRLAASPVQLKES